MEKSDLEKELKEAEKRIVELVNLLNEARGMTNYSIIEHKSNCIKLNKDPDKYGFVTLRESWLDRTGKQIYKKS